MVNALTGFKKFVNLFQCQTGGNDQPWASTMTSEQGVQTEPLDTEEDPDVI